MKTAGVVIDFYDDLSGEVLKSFFPAGQDLPGVIKTAHILSPEEREALRDEAYALILNNNGTVLRKFACVDEGNTLLSVLYFMENFDRLPEPAIKTAAAHLSEFCEEFNIPVPNLVKLAKTTGMARTRDPIRQPIIGDEADWSQRTNLVSIQGGADSGRVIPTASQMKTAAAEIHAPMGGGIFLTDEKKLNGPHKEMPTLNVSGPLPYLDDFHKVNPEFKHKQKKTKKAEVVDVTGENSPILVKRASAERTALGGKFPLDSLADVNKAIEYFNENYKYMEPIEAHIFAVKTASRADELGISINETMERYGSTTYAEDVDAHMANRIACSTAEVVPLYEELREKRASIPPEEFAEMLSQIDEVSGTKWAWGGEVADPYYATFGKVASSWSWQSRTGDFVHEENLKWLARNGRPAVHKHFASDVTNAFVKDPVAIFESLPDDAKVILARLAMSKHDGLANN